MLKRTINKLEVFDIIERKTMIRRSIVCLAFILCCLPAVAAATGDANCPGEGNTVDCLGVCNGTAVIDDCGVCDGHNKDIDDCGICFGKNKDKDDCGVCWGNNQDKDSCGVCNGGDTAKDCAGHCFGGKIEECGYCAKPGKGCEKLCKDVTPPKYYKPGLTAGCLPTSCTQYQHIAGDSIWMMIAHNCPGVFAITRGTYYNDKGLHCGCIRTPNVGCFPPEATIMTVEGAKRIDSLKAGDMVLNPVSGREVAIRKVIQSPEKNPLIEFGYGTERVRVTQTHPVYTREGLKKASDLVIGDSVLGADGSFHAISSYRLLEPRYGQQVFNLVLETSLSNPESGLVETSAFGGENPMSIDDNLLLSDGIVTGDMVLQAILNQDKQ